jgi:hypothetical protein
MPCPKLAFKYFGPFKVIQKLGSVAYKLYLPSEAQIHPVFHVSQLKPFTANYSPVYSELPMLADLAQQDVQALEIVECRMVKKGIHQIPQVHLRWTNLPAHATTWENFYVVKEWFPAAPAWGHACFGEGGDVRAESSTMGDQG